MEITEKIVILDFGGHKSQSAARLIRKMHVYCEIHPAAKAASQWMNESVRGVLFVGGDESIWRNAAESFSGAYTLIKEADFPALGGLAISKTGGFTPDMDLTAFISMLHLARNYSPETQIDQMIAEVKATVGSGRVVSGLSGGVDSTVSSVLVSRALEKDQLTCIFVDHGLLRYKEAEQVIKTYRENLGLNVVHIDTESRFLKRLAGVTEPEMKRKIIGEEFIRVFEEEAKKIGADFLLQGTIYPDIIESGVDGSATIKSHHNVGGLPKDSLFDPAHIVEPLKHLFKDEVRAVGAALGIPHGMVYRQPFPGPGIGVRLIGELRRDRLDKLRLCDAIFREEIENAGLKDSIWQYFAVLTDLQTVGVKNDQRTYADLVALRAVNTEDAMSADIAELPYPLLKKVVRRIIDEVPGVNRVVYDITEKPPGTIEWE